jgi:hypothetical protein
MFLAEPGICCERAGAAAPDPGRQAHVDGDRHVSGVVDALRRHHFLLQFLARERLPADGRTDLGHLRQDVRRVYAGCLRTTRSSAEKVLRIAVYFCASKTAEEKYAFRRQRSDFGAITGRFIDTRFICQSAQTLAQIFSRHS